MSGAFLRCLKSLDERVSIKLLMSIWGPRVEFVVRLMLVATFLDDSFRVVTHFSDHIALVGEHGYLKPLASSSPGLATIIATVALGIGLLAQSLGSICLLGLQQPGFATKALVAWTIAHPVVYAQLTNVSFVAESLSLIGGLLILLAHLTKQAKPDKRIPHGGGGLCATNDAAVARDADIERTQLVGRLLLPAVYFYFAGVIIIDNLTGAVDHTEYTSAMLVTEYAVNAAVLVALVLACALLAVGLKSRTVALALAIINLVFVCFQHPFLSFVRLEGGEWKYDEDVLRESSPHVALPKGSSMADLEAWQIVDLHQYYFFQGLSVSGALLLLAQFGPGEIAIEKDEVLVADVGRVRD